MAVQTDVRLGAAESLLNSAEEKRAWRDWYRRNACARHGVEYEPAKTVSLQHHLIEQAPQPQPQTQPQPQPVEKVIVKEPVAPEPMPTWKKAGIGAIVAAVLAGSGLSVYDFFAGSNPTPGVSLYDDIQDQGLHISPERP